MFLNVDAGPRTTFSGFGAFCSQFPVGESEAPRHTSAAAFQGRAGRGLHLSVLRGEDDAANYFRPTGTPGTGGLPPPDATSSTRRPLVPWPRTAKERGMRRGGPAPFGPPVGRVKVRWDLNRQR